MFFKIVPTKFNIIFLKSSRRGEDRWEKIIVDWTPREGKRRVGRPKTRWEDEIINYGGVAWRRDARDRKRWANVGEAYALGWAHSGR